MLAVFKTGGKQYSVKAGQILKVEKLEGKKGDSISFKDVLAVSESSQNTIGSPLVEGAVVEAKILDQIRDKKIIVFKKRKRQFLAIFLQKNPNSRYFYLTITNLGYKRPSIERTYVSSI